MDGSSSSGEVGDISLAQWAGGRLAARSATTFKTTLGVFYEFAGDT